MSNIEQRKKALLEFIGSYVDEFTFSPTVREMGAGIGGISTSVIFYYLKQLEGDGYLKRGFWGQSRGVVLTGKSIRFTDEEWHLMHSAWGDGIKEEILRAAGQTRFVITAPA